MANSQHSYSVSWTLPVDHDEEYVYVVAYLTNNATGAVLNANKSAFLKGNSNAGHEYGTKELTETEKLEAVMVASVQKDNHLILVVEL